MVRLTFRGGIHPPHGKELTADKKVENMEPRGLLVFPMSQHIGAPCRPLVKKGDRVLVGQEIGAPQGMVSSPVLSSVSGTVRNVAPMLTASGAKVMSIVVEDDRLYEEVEGLISYGGKEDLSAGEIKDIIRNSGIVGMGGACFPTHVKLSPPEGTPIDHVIINGAECEPFLTCDYRLMLEHPAEIAGGIGFIRRLFPQARIDLAIEDDKPRAIEIMGRALKDIENADVVVLRTKYPQGGEKQLIRAVTGREVPSGKLPADAGCVVDNVCTIFEIYNAVMVGRPTLTRIVSVTGDAVSEPKNLRVRLGTSFRELVEASGGFSTPPAKIMAGGPMMGTSLSTLDVPVVKGTSGILCLTDRYIGLYDESPCIRCGRCVDVCPMGLRPFLLNILSRRNDYAGFEEEGGMNCIECGCCSFMCPSRRHLVQSCREAKRSVAAARRKGR